MAHRSDGEKEPMMARARNIKPGFYKNEDLAECSIWARFIFPGLWMLADREGRLEDRPKRIKGELLPYDGPDMDKLLGELHDRGFILRYANDDGEFIQILNFDRHQSPHYSEKPSTIKPPVFSENSRKTNPIKRKDSGNSPPIKRGPQPPDSLIPDSLNPESLKETTPASDSKNQPDPGQPAAGVVPADAGTATPPPPPDPRVVAQVDALRVGLPAGTDEHEAAGELWAVLAANGCRGTAAHPSVIEMVRDGVTVAELRGAIAEARKSNDGQLNPAYLVPIVERLRSGKGKPNGKAAAWATDDTALEAKAKELGMWPTKAGSYHELRGLVRDRLARHAEESVR